MVSIIVPVYNVENYIARCVESLINQTYKNIEIILIDDGSKDKSYEICKKYSESFGFIKAIHIENHGVSYARNYGIDVSTGDYIQFVDSDDYIDSDMIETLISEQEKRKTDIVLCGYCREGNDNMVVTVPEEGDYSFYEFDKVMSVWGYDPVIGSPCNKLFISDTIKTKNIHFREEMIYGEDFCFCMEYYSHLNKYSTISKAMYHYRDTPNSLTKRNTVDVEKFWNDQCVACNSIFKFVESKGVNIENSEGAKQAYSYMCSLNFYRRLYTYGLLKSIKWFKDIVSKSEYRNLIRKTKKLSRVGNLNYVFKVLKLINALVTT